MYAALFTINACKAGCRNLGCLTADYKMDYRPLSGIALRRACGSYPPLFQRGTAAPLGACLYRAQYAKEHGHFCPTAIKNMDSSIWT